MQYITESLIGEFKEIVRTVEEAHDYAVAYLRDHDCSKYINIFPTRETGAPCITVWGNDELFVVTHVVEAAMGSSKTETIIGTYKN